MWTRRGLIAGAALLPLAARAGDNPAGLIQETEKRVGGRICVAALDTQTGRRIAWRADERFLMCSTFKLLLVARILRKVEKGEESLDRWVKYGQVDILDYAPVAKEHLAQGGMTVKDLAEASIVWSDNTCANLLLATIGGPKGVTEQARALGDVVTRLDRTEPTLNMIAPGDLRDTTSPAAMLEDMNQILLGRVLSDESRERIIDWMIASKPGPNRIGAGLPSGWKRGHKTGTGMGGSTNDIAIIWPPGRKPILLAVYATGSKASDAEIEGAIADVARIVSGIIRG